MGNWLSTTTNWFPFLRESIFPSKDKRIVFLGLDSVGKTTIVYQLKLGETVKTISTTGFNVETIQVAVISTVFLLPHPRQLLFINFQYKNLRLTMWDAGGQSHIRGHWRYHLDNTDLLVFVIDSTDVERMEDATNELHNLLLNDFLSKTPLLVLANKQDLPNAMSVPQIGEKLGE